MSTIPPTLDALPKTTLLDIRRSSQNGMESAKEEGELHVSSNSVPIQSFTHPRIHAEGEMAELISAKDWSQTPLGPIEGWSEALIAVVNHMLNYPFSFSLYWGAERTMLYNDTYRVFLYDKHPWALGQVAEKVWGEAWGQVGPEINGAYEGRKTTLSEALIPIFDNGVLEDHWFTYGLYPVYDGDQIAGVANPGRDDSERVKTRIALENSEERLTQVLQATQDAVATIDRDWRFTYVNPKAEQMYGKGLVGRNAWEAFPEIVYEGSPFVKFAHRAMDEGLPGQYEEHFPGPLDITINVDVYPSVDGIIVFSRDVTERNRTAAALLQNEKLAAVGRLASSIAHEINNPLESVTNLLYLAQSNAEPGPMREYLELAERELRRVSVISNQTLRFNKQSTRATVVTCSDLFAEALSIYQGRLVNSSITVEKRKRAKRPAECFEGEIRQVLSNFMSNAIDAMQNGSGRLLLRSREATHWKTGEKGLVLTVADTGPGIAPNQQQKIFHAFYTTKGIGGTGLGLWISREIVERHRGTIRFRSSQRTAHHGTVFNLFLPFQAAVRPAI